LPGSGGLWIYSRVRLTLSIPSFGPFFPPGRLHEVIELARRAEAAGVDTVTSRSEPKASEAHEVET
jgi:hypothetical protein